MKKALLFSGSNNPQSINQKLVVVISELITTTNTIIDLRDYEMPMFSMAAQDFSGVPTQAMQLKKELERADVIVISVPEYNGSMPAFFKNILDWLSRCSADYKVFDHKPILLLSASPGRGGHTTLAHTETVLSRLGGIVKGKIVVDQFFTKTVLNENKLRLTDNTIINQVHEILHRIN